MTVVGHRTLQDPVTWYGINYAGTQMTQWDFQNKGKSGWTGTSSFVLEVPLRHLRPSVIYSVPCDRILQRAFCLTYMLDYIVMQIRKVNREKGYCYLENQRSNTLQVHENEVNPSEW